MEASLQAASGPPKSEFSRIDSDDCDDDDDDDSDCRYNHPLLSSSRNGM
jgi:hypothetical protein